MLLRPASAVRHRPAATKRQLPITLILIGALAVILSLTTLGFGLLTFSSIQYRRNKPHQAVAPRVPPAAAPVPVVADFKIIEEHLREAKARAQQLDENEQQAHIGIASLEQQELQLTQAIEQRQSAIRDAQVDLRRLKEEQQRIQALRTEAADLERRIAALRASIEAARQTANIGRAAEATTSQIVECVRGGIILEPQQTQIAFSALQGSVLASLARKRGVYFLVRPSGFESFIAARDIARSAGKVVGYEPVQPGAEDR